MEIPKSIVRTAQAVAILGLLSGAAAHNAHADGLKLGVKVDTTALRAEKEKSDRELAEIRARREALERKMVPTSGLSDKPDFTKYRAMLAAQRQQNGNQ